MPRSFALGVIHVLSACLVTGCVSVPRYEAMRHRAEAAEAETEKALMYLAGQQEDNAMLQKALIESEMELRRWQMGSMLQADREADLRESCDI